MNAELLKFPVRVISPEDSGRTLENAVVRLLKYKPFYGHLLLGFRRRAASGQYAVGVTVSHGTPVLSIDPELFSA